MEFDPCVFFFFKLEVLNTCKVLHVLIKLCGLGICALSQKAYFSGLEELTIDCFIGVGVSITV